MGGKNDNAVGRAPVPPAILRADLALHCEGAINGPPLRKKRSDLRRGKKRRLGSSAGKNRGLGKNTAAPMVEENGNASSSSSASSGEAAVQFQRRCVSALPRVADLLSTHGHTLWRILCDCDVSNVKKTKTDTAKEGGRAVETENPAAEEQIVGQSAQDDESGDDQTGTILDEGESYGEGITGKRSLLGLVRYGRYYAQRGGVKGGAQFETPATVSAALSVPLSDVLQLNAWRYQLGRASNTAFNRNARFTLNARIDFRPATRPLFFLGRATQQFVTEELPRGALGGAASSGGKGKKSAASPQSSSSSSSSLSSLP